MLLPLLLVQAFNAKAAAKGLTNMRAGQHIMRCALAVRSAAEASHD
jgi:hypothetical protein